MRRDIAVLSGLITLSVIMFLPILNKGFASDDFAVMARVVYGSLFYLDGFFRPLSDISLYGCYLIAGFEPWTYNLFNIVLHALSGFLLYKTALLLFSSEKKASLFAVTAAVLFVVYPFHQEAIVWVVGRASNLSSFLSFLALYLSLSGRFSVPRAILVGLLYFASLSTYETSITMPLIVAGLVYLLDPLEKKWKQWLVLFAVVTLLNICTRYFLVHELAGEYGSRMFDTSIVNNLFKFSKTFGRLFLPPMNSSSILVMLTTAVGVLLLLLTIRMLKYEQPQKKTFWLIFVSFMLSCAIPFLFGVSTKTIEGDRLLYFPSFFLCIWVSYVLGLLLTNRSYLLVCSCIGIYFSCFLQYHNLIWRKADSITTTIIRDMAVIKKTAPNLMVLNLPEEYKGAHIFRNGFKEALFLNGIDSSGIQMAGKVSIDSITPNLNYPHMQVIYWNNQNMVIFR